jgi:4-amino-4-deoxy-L-arabinose transferase-like glycosyltransferase
MYALHLPWAAPILSASGSLKIVQILSLGLSIASLIVIYQIVFETPLIQAKTARLYSFALICFLPQFIMFTLYVSNDTLAIFMGCLTVLQTYRFIQLHDWKQTLLLAVVLGLGLLTKATFLAFLAVLFGLMLFMGTRMGRPLAKAVGMAFAFFAVAGVLGSYKYVDNYQRFRDPFMNTLDSAAPWVVSQKESYMGLCSYLDINLLHLLASPTVDPGALPSVSQSDGRGSYPLLMYGTFWYQHIYESINFTGNRHRPFNYLGSVIYMIAVVPTAVFIVGLGAIASRFPKFIAQFDYRKDDDRHLLWKYVIVCFFIANLALLLGTVFKYHVWSIMQSRLLFPSIVGALGAFGAGVSIVSRIRISAIILKSSMLLLVGLFWLYLSSEVGFQILGHDPGVKAFLKSLELPLSVRGE